MAKPTLLVVLCFLSCKWLCFQVAAQCCGHRCPRHTSPVPVPAPSPVCTAKTCGITSENCIGITVPEGVSTTLGCQLKPFLLSLSEEYCFFRITMLHCGQTPWSILLRLKFKPPTEAHGCSEIRQTNNIS